MRSVLAAALVIGATACTPASEKTSGGDSAAASGPITPVKADVPAGAYTLDKAHTSLIFRVSHLGLSNYTARFTGVDAKLQLDPARPEASQLTATVDPRSLETDFPLPAPDFDAELQGSQWLDAARFPTITFRSTAVELTGPDTARIPGELTLHGVTRPLVLEAKFNGGYAANAMDPAGSRIGFSAKGRLKRSEYGVAYGIPAPGTTMGVSDEVEIIIETEFTRPADAAAATTAPS